MGHKELFIEEREREMVSLSSLQEGYYLSSEYSRWRNYYQIKNGRVLEVFMPLEDSDSKEVKIETTSLSAIPKVPKDRIKEIDEVEFATAFRDAVSCIRL